MNMKKIKGLEKVIPLCAYLLMLFICTELFYRQSIEYNQVYPSDLPLHLYYAVSQTETNYSLVLLIFNFLYHINGTTFYIAAFLSSMVVATIYLTYVFIKDIVPNMNKTFAHALAFALNLVMPIFIPALNSTRYLGLITGSIWHNSTFTCMKLLGIIVLLVFNRLYKDKDNLKTTYWFAFIFFLCVVTIVKPNYILVFAPAVFTLLLFDKIQKETTLKRAALLLLSFLPVCLVLMFQYIVVYGSAETDAGLSINFGFIISHYAQQPLAAVIQSIVFPILVLLINFKSLKKDKMYLFSWILWLIALVQYLFLVETGERALHGNWGWGVQFFTFFLFVMSAMRLIRNVIVELKPADNQPRRIISLRRIYYCLTSVVFLLHVYDGIQYFLIIVHGDHYQ